MARFAPEKSLGLKENHLDEKVRDFLTLTGFSFKAREVSGEKRALCYFCGFPLSPETSVEQHPGKNEKFAIFFFSKT